MTPTQTGQGGSKFLFSGPTEFHITRASAPRISGGKALYKLLQNAAPAAFHNSRERSDPPRCHPKTRKPTLQTILDFSSNRAKSSARILWLDGPAGAGKSAIAQTVADTLSQKQGLAASFFFSHIPSEDQRHHEQRLILTIAYQLIQNIPSIRPYIEDVITHNPAVFGLNLDDQVEALILYPFQRIQREEPAALNHEGPPRMIIVDGLDECGDKQAQLRVLRSLQRLVKQDTFPFAVLITSRSEHPIPQWFHERLTDGTACRISLEECTNKDEDIEIFVTEGLVYISQSHPYRHHITPGWPSKKLIQRIVHKSSGQFIYAKTVLTYLNDAGDIPDQRLDALLRASGDQDPNSSPYTGSDLDILFSSILDKLRNVEEVLPILAFQLLCPLVQYHSARYTQNQFNRHPFATHLLSLQRPMDFLIRDLISIVKPRDKCDWEPLIFYHQSLCDFLTDRKRAPNQIYLNMEEWLPKLLDMVSFQLHNYLGRPWYVEDLPGPLYVLFLWKTYCTYVAKAKPTIQIRNEILRWTKVTPTTLFNLVEHLDPITLLNIISEVRLDDAPALLRNIISTSFLPPLQNMISIYLQQPTLPPELLIISSLPILSWAGQRNIASIVRYVHISLKKKVGTQNMEQLFKTGAYNVFEAYSNVTSRPILWWKEVLQYIITHYGVADSSNPTIKPIFSPNDYSAAALYYLQVLKTINQTSRKLTLSTDVMAMMLRSASLSQELASELKAYGDAAHKDEISDYLNLIDVCARGDYDLSILPKHQHFGDQHSAHYISTKLGLKNGFTNELLNPCMGYVF